MNKRLDLRDKHRQILEALIIKYLPGVDVWVYGSRINGRSHDGSDLDLVLRSQGLTAIGSSKVECLKEALQESNIPFLVEVRDWVVLPESFHKEIERNHLVLVGGQVGGQVSV